MAHIIPAILTNNPDEAKALVVSAETKTERVQIDIIDGIFADNKTIDPVVFEEVETTLKLDYHLMVKNPINWVERCIRGGADRIIGQIEMMESQAEFVGKVEEVGAYVGLAIDIDTPVSKLDPTIITNLDAVLVMSVPAGFGGQEFNEKALDKIKELDEIRLRDTSPFKIIIDGGVSLEVLTKLLPTGVDEVAIGRKIFEGDLEANLEKFRGTGANKNGR